MTAGRRQGGFTLVEVMLALAILFAGLAVLIQTTARNIYTADRSYMLGVATNLARAKMYDLEEHLLQDGFSDVDEEESGDFEEQGWPDIRWEAEIIRPEIPDLAAMAQALQNGEEMPGAEEDEGALGAETEAGMEGEEGMAGGLAALIPPIVLQTLQGVLEESMRKIELRVMWNSARGEESMLVEAYITEPKRVNAVLGGLGGLAPGGGEAEGGGEEDGGDDGSGGGEGGEQPRRGGQLRDRQ